MLFNSIEFAIFLPIVFILYWALRKHFRFQLYVLLIASYIFYGWWDWRFLSLIIFSSGIDFLIGKRLDTIAVESKRKMLLGLSLLTNLGLLGFFKYYNFFSESLSEAFTFFGKEIPTGRLDIILPVGISFYTFQTLSYTIDVYRRKLEPTDDWLAFFGFVSFFPQLVAGPIERASHLLGQFQKPRIFDYSFAVSGLRLIIWGMFKKIVIADNAAFMVDEIFLDYTNQSSLSLMLGVVLFAFQIYGDFSGYSDIAIGLSRIFGFDLMLNFRFPYLAQNINDFWKRWHISLSSWFRDYVYIPLGGSRVSTWASFRNVLIVFLVSGFWHGANWTFIIWGLIHGILYVPFFFMKPHQDLHEHSILKNLPKIFLTFTVVCLGWIFFRADSVSQAFNYIGLMFTNEGSSNFIFEANKRKIILGIVLLCIMGMMIIEGYFESKQKKEVLLPSWSLVLIVLFIFYFGGFKNHESFIYFQF
ncbi:MBOAT family O-acyltransferase [Algoriphagus halophilus]|uniref:D-alanyl-lipoteichoic acid acyltransferase DltB, MBOAT superfamily n=1 Tax=Algoriphagus halophilus TaxID=226505 RepID=A0A1N6GCH3_9BACT|nr:MBOAT family O-acyltransferase [Algoriphagus halophilus]SIO05226.1 D-alanyl-lipoteichoic acid acyltransferase DltB, MBOAT superfamily [Algoriphagus halophilus]